jgi:hypothetical protein
MLAFLTDLAPGPLSSYFTAKATTYSAGVYGYIWSINVFMTGPNLELHHFSMKPVPVRVHRLMGKK